MKYLLLLLVLFFTASTLAQSNFQKGSVVNNAGEVLTGYIDLQQWENNPKYIRFKSKPEEQEAQKIYPATFRSFTIDGFEKYDAYTGKVSMDHVRFPDLNVGVDTSNRIETVFLKVIASGRFITLYDYTDSLKTRFFFREKDNAPIELSYKQYYDSGGTNVIVGNTYNRQLSYLANKYRPEDHRLAAQAASVDYGYGISNVINELNGNKIVKKSTSGFLFFAGAAFEANQTGFNGVTEFGNARQTNFTSKLSAGFDFFTNPRVQKFVFRFELGLWRMAPHFTGYLTGDTPDEATVTYYFTQYNVTFTPQLIWNLYNTENFKLYIGGGLGMNFSSYSNQAYYVRGTYGNSDFPPFKLENFWFNFPFRTGVLINKHLELFLTYTPDSSLTNSYDIFQVATTTYSAGINFLFGKTQK